MKHTFVTKHGETICSDRFLNAPKLAKGYEWRDVSPIGDDKGLWVETPTQPDTVTYRGELFGYDEKSFLAKQYL